MRILVDLGSHVTGNPAIVQVERTPVAGITGSTAINGKFAIPVIDGADFPVDVSSYVLDGGGDVDGGDVASIAYAHLLAKYPQFANIYFNPLLTAAHVDEIDFTASFTDVLSDPPNVHLYPVRVQTGRPSAFAIPGPAGQMPMNTALLPINSGVGYPSPGVLVTKAIDVSAFIPAGATTFMAYWKLYAFGETHDVSHDMTNTPAIRTLMETDQEPRDFMAFISMDDGASWTQVGLLEPIGVLDAVPSIRLAFLNIGADKIYIASYAVLF